MKLLGCIYKTFITFNVLQHRITPTKIKTMEIVITVALLLIVDVVGYILKIESDKSFKEFKLRHIPFIWFFWS